MPSVKREILPRQAGPRLWELYYAGGGELPDTLKSKYTTELMAVQARDRFFAGKLNAGKKPTVAKKKK